MDGSESVTAIAGLERNRRLQFSYTSLFCEENVHKMISRFKTLMGESSYPAVSFHAVFISSRSKQTPLWHQKAGVCDEPVWWDYHVILVAKSLSTAAINVLCHTAEEVVISDSIQGNRMISSDRADINSPVPEPNQNDQHLRSYVFDLDSSLPFPTPAHEYYHKAMRPELEIPVEHVQVFRVVPAVDFLNYFSSDRSHMVRSGAVFPPWPCIRGASASSSMNLRQYFTMKKTEESYMGQVMTGSEFEHWLSSDGI